MQEIRGLLERAGAALGNQLLLRYSQAYQESIGGLPSKNVPIPTSQCEGRGLPVMEGCLKDFRKKMRTMLQGGNESQTTLNVVPGTDPANNIPFSCNGINDCVAKLENVQSNIDTDIAKTESNRNVYTVAFNASVDRFTEAAGQKLKYLNDDLVKKLERL